MRSPRILAITLAALAFVAALPAAATATWAGKPGRIAYYALAERDGMYSVRPDGSGNRFLVRSDGGGVAWSRDGRRIAFFRGSAGDELWQARADGSRARRVLDISGSRRTGFGYGSDVAWAPNGRRLVFTATVEDQVGEEDVRETQTIYTVRRDGKRLRKLRRGHSPVWSPRGRIAFAEKDGDIATMRHNGRGYDRIWVPQGSPFSDGLDFSPNGRRLAWQESVDLSGDRTREYIRTLNLRTGRRTRFRDLTRAVNAMDVAWAPGGRRLAFIHWTNVDEGPAPPNELRTIRPNGTRRKTLFKFPEDPSVFEFAWQAR